MRSLRLIEARSADDVTGAAPARLARRVTPRTRGMLAFAAAVVIVLLAVGIGRPVPQRWRRSRRRAPGANHDGGYRPSTTAAQTTTTSRAGAGNDPMGTGLDVRPRSPLLHQVISDGDRLVAVSAESDTAPGPRGPRTTDEAGSRSVLRACRTDGLPGRLIAGPDGFGVVGAGAVRPTRNLRVTPR